LLFNFFIKGTELKQTEFDPENYEVAPFDVNALREMIVSRVFLIGVNSLDEIRNTITSASHFFQLREKRLPMKASVLLSADKKSSYLVFGPNSFISQSKLFARDDVFSFDDSIWADDGLYRAYNGITHTDTGLNRTRNDIVENENIVHTSFKNDSPLVAPLPSKIIFICSASKDLPEISLVKDPRVAMKLFESSSTLFFEPGSGQYSKFFSSLFETTKPDVIVINNSGRTNEKVSGLVKSATAQAVPEHKNVNYESILNRK